MDRLVIEATNENEFQQSIAGFVLEMLIAVAILQETKECDFDRKDQEVDRQIKSIKQRCEDASNSINGASLADLFLDMAQ